jgi:hypothetical protein
VDENVIVTHPQLRHRPVLPSLEEESIPVPGRKNLTPIKII